MHVLPAHDINDAYAKGIYLFRQNPNMQTRYESRNGDTVMMNDPVTTIYENPRFRVISSERRDANPFFHLFEALWMLDGGNDVKTLDHFNSKMKRYSDDGATFHGAYGHRWRRHFGTDQLEILINLFRNNPKTRRGVLQMWDCGSDLYQSEMGKDIPCNDLIKFEINNSDQLDMIVFCRSNDMILGCYGANAVHMSLLQEYMANRLEVDVGRYWQVSCNFHYYTNTWDEKKCLDDLDEFDSWGTTYLGAVAAYPFIVQRGHEDKFQRDLHHIITTLDQTDVSTPFLGDVAGPMLFSWNLWKAGEKDRARKALDVMSSGLDWTVACKRWMERRMS